MSSSQPDRLDRLEATLTRFAELQIQNNLRQDQAIAQLTERVDTLSAEVGHLVGAIADYIVEAEADREIIKQNQAEIRQNQAEIRRIWEYLLRQNPNGRGEG